MRIFYLSIRSFGLASYLRDSMRVLNVAEKNAAASAIAYILAKGQLNKRDSHSKYNKLFEFQCNVFGQPCSMIMTSVSGHLMETEFPPGYKKWHEIPPVALFEAPVLKNVSSNMLGIKQTLEQEARKAQKLVIWTDCDREGENIGYEVIDVCSKINPRLDIYRAKFSEMTPAAINRAINNLGRPDPRLSKAVDVRSELDLRTGAAFTRFQTLRLQRLYRHVLEQMVISYGSCQFPTLGFVVDRYKQIRDFVIEDFWKIKLTHSVNDQVADFNWARVRLFDEQACRAILQLLQENPIATVTSVASKPKSKWRPQAMDTVEMEKLAVRKLKMTAKKAMHIAESLYTRGIISYPRTETNIFPREMNLNGLVEQHVNHPNWGNFAGTILNNGGVHPRNGHKTDNAHPPIHPTKCVGPGDLEHDDGRLYELIARHFLACCSADAEGKEYVVEIDVNGESFSASGLTVLALNYLEVYPYEKWSEKTIPEYQQGQQFRPTVLDIVPGQTAPPPLLSEADLITLMEKHGIGTDATHAEHIDKIQQRLYVGVTPEGRFTPGELGMGLVEGYDLMGFCMSKPNLRAEFEADLGKICEGTADPQVVLANYIAKYREIFIQASQQVKKLDDAMAQYFGAPAAGNENDDGGGGGGGGGGGPDGGDGGGAGGAIDVSQIHKLSTCPSCKADVLLKTRKTGGFYFGCLGYPNCRVAVFLPEFVQRVSVLEEVCQRCSFHPRLVELHFKPNEIPVGLEARHKCCLGGCDNAFFELIGTRPLVSSSRATSGSFGSSSAANVSMATTATTTALSVAAPQQSTALSTVVRQQWPASRDNATGLNTQRSAPSQQYNNRTSGGGAESSSSADVPVRPLANTNNNFNVLSRGGDGGSVLCTCNKPAAKLTVRKEGANQGRQFYKCADQLCTFFLWHDEDPSASGGGGGASSRQTQQQKTCSACGQPAMRLVAKNGQNAGRAFWSCRRPGEGGCGKWLEWADDSDGTTSDGFQNDRPGGGATMMGRGRGAPQTHAPQFPINRPGFLGGGRAIGSSGGGRGRGGGAAAGGRGRGGKRSFGGGDDGESPSAPKQRKCGACGQPGHNRKNCPNQ